MGNVFIFFSETKASENHGHVLAKMMARIKSLPNQTCEIKSLPNQTCENCKQTSCLNGQVLTRENFVPGAQLTLANGLLLGISLCLTETIGNFKYINSHNETFYTTLNYNNIKYKCVW